MCWRSHALVPVPSGQLVQLFRFLEGGTASLEGIEERAPSFARSSFSDALKLIFFDELEIQLLDVCLSVNSLNRSRVELPDDVLTRVSRNDESLCAKRSAVEIVFAILDAHFLFDRIEEAAVVSMYC